MIDWLHYNYVFFKHLYTHWATCCSKIHPDVKLLEILLVLLHCYLWRMIPSHIDASGQIIISIVFYDHTGCLSNVPWTTVELNCIYRASFDACGEVGSDYPKHLSVHRYESSFAGIELREPQGSLNEMFDDGFGVTISSTQLLLWAIPSVCVTSACGSVDHIQVSVNKRV